MSGLGAVTTFCRQIHRMANTYIELWNWFMRSHMLTLLCRVCLRTEMKTMSYTREKLLQSDHRISAFLERLNWEIIQSCHEILSAKFKDILRIFSRFSRMLKLGWSHVKITCSRAAKFKDFNDHFQGLFNDPLNFPYNWRTFQGFQESTWNLRISRILQGPGNLVIWLGMIYIQI